MERKESMSARDAARFVVALLADHPTHNATVAQMLRDPIECARAIHLAKVSSDQELALERAAYALGLHHGRKLAARSGARRSNVRGVCRTCGCTDEDCSGCIERTGEPCYWVDATHTLCSACAPNRKSQLANRKSREPRKPEIETPLSFHSPRAGRASRPEATSTARPTVFTEDQR